MEKMLIVDGMNLLFQMFYGMPARITDRTGRPIQGVIGFVGALLKMVRMVNPQYICVVFDGQTHNPRKDLDGAYKANRPDYSQMPEEETPFSQLPAIFDALCYLGICYRETADCEADDWIAGFARRYGGDYAITVASQDSDFFQLISENVDILRYRGDCSVRCDAGWLFEKYGIRPDQYAAFKSLTGDTADNIRGVDKVGPKTAAWLLQTYDTLDGVIENAGLVTKPSIRKSLEESLDRLRKNYELICLTGCACLPFTPEQMAWQYQGQTTTQVLRAIDI